MRRLSVLIYSLTLVCAADGGKQAGKTTTNTSTSQRVSTKSTQHMPTKGSQHVSSQRSHHVAAPVQHPATSNVHVQRSHIQRSQPGYNSAGITHFPKDGGGRIGPTGVERDTDNSGSRINAAKPAASVPPTPVYHYNFRSKSGVIGRDFTKPLTGEEQSAIAREIENQPKGMQGAHGGDVSGNGAYHYNFRTKSGMIGRDFVTPLTPDQQSAIARQVEKGQPEGTQSVHGGYDPENGAYHYNFRTKSGMVGRDFATPLTPDQQSAIAREVENGPLEGTRARRDGRSVKTAVTRRSPKQFTLPSKPNPAVVGAKFEGTGHIPGSENWTDAKYKPFHHYRHEWHDKQWWEHHCDRTHRNCPSVPIVLVYGGWYSWHAGYWYPAWGYESQSSYYPYDGPIYAYSGLAPDQVIANVQAALQALGYYHGPIDGLLGAATQEAIANYQRDHGLYITSAIDEPTLAELGMS